MKTLAALFTLFALSSSAFAESQPVLKLICESKDANDPAMTLNLAYMSMSEAKSNGYATAEFATENPLHTTGTFAQQLVTAQTRLKGLQYLHATVDGARGTQKFIVSLHMDMRFEQIHAFGNVQQFAATSAVKPVQTFLYNCKGQFE